jgi:hypothetical protein
MALQPAPPAKIILQILPGDTVKAHHSAFKAAVIGVHVFDVIDLGQHTNAPTQAELTMRQGNLAGSLAINCRPVAAQNGIFRHVLAQNRRDVNNVRISQLEVGSGTVPISQDQHRHLL